MLHLLIIPILLLSFLLADKYGKFNILHYASYKSRRVTRSVLGAEVYAFADAFDLSYVKRHDLEAMLGQRIPLQMLTDSRSLFDVIQRLMIDIKDVRESYENHLISNVGFVRSEDNPADAFTKPKHCDALNRIMTTGFIDLHVDEWITRKASSKDINKSFEEKKRECESKCSNALWNIQDTSGSFEYLQENI